MHNSVARLGANPGGLKLQRLEEGMITPTNTGEDDLLVTEAATAFALSESGRIQRENDPDRSEGPRMYLAGCESGNIVRIRHDVEDETVREIEALVASEPPLANPDSTPLHLAEYVDLLDAKAPVEQKSLGMNYCFPDDLWYEHDVTLVSSDTPEGDRLLSSLAADRAMPDNLESLGFRAVTDIWAPWCVALRQGEIASIGMTARIGPTGAAAGVVTVPESRGRGFAAAAMAGWASHPSLQGRTLFYGTQRTNVSSQRVAARLGLHFIGASFRLT
ncbi:MAG: GNAT family N-acetyltransferase [Chloroflexi bacterium]|nr:GNAT family N-acetyltransferase [Chloroflexota bacterium]